MDPVHAMPLIDLLSQKTFVDGKKLEFSKRTTSIRRCLRRSPLKHILDRRLKTSHDTRNLNEYTTALRIEGRKAAFERLSVQNSNIGHLKLSFYTAKTSHRTEPPWYACEPQSHLWLKTSMLESEEESVEIFSVNGKSKSSSCGVALSR